ncbi:MAG: ribosome-binding factor [Bacteroidetes bacterium]|jgi:ribosome-binding factor A|nr:ribosome-binding factor [Bacteroidota bacterium]
MESVRQSKVNRLLQKELAEIFRSESKTLLEGAFISVTQVRVTPDLGLAKVYLSIMLPKDKEKALELVNSQKFAIRKLLIAKIRNQFKAMPELIFYIDDSLDYAERIDQLLK